MGHGTVAKLYLRISTVSPDNCGVTGELQNPIYFDIGVVDFLNVVGHDDNFSRRPETPAEPASDADAVSDGETPSARPKASFLDALLIVF